ncbi:alpha-1,2-fucosyltransferase [Haloarcula marina]|uniref:alpha-1,2-fucosyltransferase n=1 Tax=Haloarcula marina TaxID=2961574 RepID=UPI0020B788F2|nr:alpha-1,2-fucosyltransferase [Halomicroarcula marina]
MIIASLKGGMGNQMFQYATGLRLADAYDTQLKVDLSFFDTTVNGFAAYQTPADTVFFHLDNFDISAEEASSQDVYDVIRFGRLGKRIARTWTGSRFRSHTDRLRANYSVAGRLLNYYRERECDEGRFNPSLLDGGPNCYIDGYWESPRYFESIKERLESEFALRDGLTDAGEDVATEIRNTHSVGLHVRRGDVTQSGNALPTEYYERALQAFAGEDVTVFVFSVDQTWVRENVDIGFPTVYVDHLHAEDGKRTPDAYEYFRLFNLCDHKVIANSTFSWWGAWLNETDETRVLCPYIWKPNYPESGMRYVGNIDLIPEEWRIVKWD